MFHTRGFRGGRKRSGPRPVIQSFKKVLFFVQASFSSGFQSEQLVLGVDSVAAGQTSATDAGVPTGSLVKFIEVQFAVNNSVATPAYVNCTLQLIQSQQTALDPGLVGGNTRRNNVFHMDMFSIGQDQNSTHKFKFKIPKGFQRVKEGTQWALVWSNSATVNRQCQAIYKFYR